MKTRQPSDAAPTTPATHNTNSSAPPQTGMTSSPPNVKNRQTVDQKRARYGQARNLPAYQRDTHIKKIKTTKQGGSADIQQAPKPDGLCGPSAKPTTNNPFIVRFRGSDTSKLDMSFRNMGDADVLALANFLRDNTTVTSLKLDYCSICTAGARALAEALNVNTTLKTLELCFNDIGAEGAVALSEVLRVNTTLTTLHLGGNDIGAEGAVVLSEVLRFNTTLTTLYLGGNEIGSKGAVALSKALLGNTTLTTLDLNLNFIGAEGAVALAEALLGNTTLTTLDLNHNRIGAEGTVALANALKFNTKLRTLCLLCAVPDTYAAAELADALKFNTTLTNLIVDFYSYVYSTLWGKFSDLLKRNRLLELQSFAEASLDLLVRHSPALKGMGVTTDVLPVLAQQLSTEVLAVFEQEWKEAFRAPPPPITTTTTNTTTTTTTTTTTDATIPLTLTTSPAPIVTSPASVPPVSTQPIATAAEINALQADPNPVVALSRWIDGHANPAAALNWVDSANGYTLLHYAVVAQQGAVVRNLLTRGIDRTKADQNNQTAAQLAQQRADSSSSQAVAAIAALFE